MKTVVLSFLLSATSAFVPVVPMSRSNSIAPLAMVDLANGSMSFDRVCREWRCKYEGDKSDSKALEQVAKAVEEYLPKIKEIESMSVNRLVCGACKDFKLMMTVDLDQFGKWEEKGFEPESEFLEKIKAIDGISQVETQTITNMVI